MASSVWSADLSAIDGIDNSFEVRSGSGSPFHPKNQDQTAADQQRMLARKGTGVASSVPVQSTNTNNTSNSAARVTALAPSRSALLSEAYLTKTAVRPALSFASSSAGSLLSLHSSGLDHASGPVAGPASVQSVQQLSSISNNTSSSAKLVERTGYATTGAGHSHLQHAQVGIRGSQRASQANTAQQGAQDIDALVDSALMHTPGRRAPASSAHHRGEGLLLTALHAPQPPSPPVQQQQQQQLHVAHVEPAAAQTAPAASRLLASRAESEAASAYSRQSVPVPLQSPLNAVPLPIPGPVGGLDPGDATQQVAPASLLKSLLPVSPAMDTHRLVSVISTLAVAYRQLELVSTHRAAELNHAKADVDSAIAEMRVLQLQVAEAAELNGFLRHAFEQLQGQWENTGCPPAQSVGTHSGSHSVIGAALALPSLAILRGEALQIAAQRLKENRAEIASLSQHVQHVSASLRDAQVWQGAGAAGLRAEIDRLNQQVAAAGALATAKTNQADGKVAEAVRLAQLAEQEKAVAEAGRADAVAQLQLEKQSNSQLRSLLTSASVREDELKQRLAWAEEAIHVLKSEIRQRDSLLAQQMGVLEAVQASGALSGSALQAMLQGHHGGTHQHYQVQQQGLLGQSSVTVAGDPSGHVSMSLGQDGASSVSASAATTSALLGRSAAVANVGASASIVPHSTTTVLSRGGSGAVHELSAEQDRVELVDGEERPTSPAQQSDHDDGQSEVGSLTEETLAAAIEQAKAQARAVALARAQEGERVRLEQLQHQQEYVAGVYNGPDCHCGPTFAGPSQQQGWGEASVPRPMRPVRVTGAALESMELLGHTLQDVLESQEQEREQLQAASTGVAVSLQPLPAVAAAATADTQHGEDREDGEGAEGEWVDVEPCEEQGGQEEEEEQDAFVAAGASGGAVPSALVKRVGRGGGPPGGSDSDLLLDASASSSGNDTTTAGRAPGPQ